MAGFSERKTKQNWKESVQERYGVKEFMKEHEVNEKIGHRAKPLPNNELVNSIKPRKMGILKDRIGQRLYDREVSKPYGNVPKEYLGKFGTDAKLEDRRLTHIGRLRAMKNEEHITQFETSKSHQFSKE